MKCPECVAAGERSDVYVGWATRTAMFVQTYYDADGVFHHHDPNIRHQTYWCSRGHDWSEGRRSPCPAGDYNTSPAPASPS